MTDNRWVCTLEADENGDLILPIPDDLWRELSWEIGDEVDFVAKPGELKIVNLSMQTLPVSKLRREFSGVLRKMKSTKHPLNRVLVSRNRNIIAIMVKHPWNSHSD